MRKNLKPIQVWVKPSIHRKLVRLAKEDGRHLRGFVERVLEKVARGIGHDMET